MITRLLTTLITLGVGACLALAVVAQMPAASAAVTAHVSSAKAPKFVQETVATAPLISYQGRLLDPLSGQNKPDGSYTMTFRFYTVATGGAALWTESKSVNVNKGLFSTLLGDTTPLDLTIFDGQDLFLGVTVGSDPETAPRQRIAHTIYAIYAENAATANNAALLENKAAADFALSNHTHNSSSIADESLTAADIQNRTRNISYPANALNFAPGGSVVTQAGTGLEWTASFSGSAYLWVTKPRDWDGTSDVVLTIYFQVTSNSSGTAGYFIRPRSYNAGNVFADATSQNADRSPTVTVSANGVRTIYSQTFTIPANKLTRENWVVSFQRLGSGTESYTDNVILHTIDLSYTAVQ